jgi:hypothetical protein
MKTVFLAVFANLATVKRTGTFSEPPTGFNPERKWTRLGAFECPVPDAGTGLIGGMSVTSANRLTPAAEARSSADVTHQPFSHMQWYLNHARNTVHFAAQTSRAMSEQDFHNLVELIVSWAPQLTTRTDTDNNRHVAMDVDHRKICRFAETDDLDRALAETVALDDRLMDDPSLPDFRAYCYRLVPAPKKGVQTLVVCCTSHALMEGSETSRLMRSRQSVHNADQETLNLGPVQRALIGAAGVTLAPLHLLASRFNRTDIDAGQAAAFDIDRQAVKAIAARLGVRQRSVLFTLPLFALRERLTGRRKKAHFISYSTLPDAKTTLEDSALNLRMQVARLPTAEDFTAEVHATEGVLAREDTRELYSQATYNATLGVHRQIQKSFRRSTVGASSPTSPMILSCRSCPRMSAEACCAACSTGRFSAVLIRPAPIPACSCRTERASA